MYRGLRGQKQTSHLAVWTYQHWLHAMYLVAMDWHMKPWVQKTI